MKNTLSNPALEKLIFALDAADAVEALDWVDRLSGFVGMFKVGKELFTACGPDIVREIKGRGQKVFLDLKFHDIPNTVARASESACRLGVDMFNLHASGGRDMICQAVAAVDAWAVQSGKPKPIVLAVTVLTSLNDNDLAEIGFEKSTSDQVLHLARLALASGATGIVASPRELAWLRLDLPADFVMVTPGIRSASDGPADDQKRTLSAHAALKAGADYVVVGRPIRKAADPVQACHQIVSEIAAGMAER